MQKAKKRFFGLVSLFLVAVMTIVAYYLPVPDAAAESVTQTIVVRVTDKYPSVVFFAPENESSTVNPEVNVKFDYENAKYVEFTLSWTDEDGVTHSATLPQFTPPSSAIVDEVLGTATGTGTLTIDLEEYGGVYAEYVISANVVGAASYDEDSVEFYYTPAKSTKIGTTDDNDPIIEVENADGVKEIEIMVYDKNGNPVFDEPIIVKIDEPYERSSTEVILPLGSYGINSGDYTIALTAYDADGDSLYIPQPAEVVAYVVPEAPEVPNTGHFLESFNISSADYIITSVVAFLLVVFFAFVILGKKNKKDYRKNYRNRR